MTRCMSGQDRKPGEVDLHGLYVKEAIAYTDQSVVEARTRGDKELRLIVGSCSVALHRYISVFILLPRERHSLSESRGEAQASY
jgi:hypothetical protein